MVLVYLIANMRGVCWTVASSPQNHTGFLKMRRCFVKPSGGAPEQACRAAVRSAGRTIPQRGCLCRHLLPDSPEHVQPVRRVPQPVTEARTHSRSGRLRGCARQALGAPWLHRTLSEPTSATWCSEYLQLHCDACGISCFERRADRPGVTFIRGAAHNPVEHTLIAEIRSRYRNIKAGELGGEPGTQAICGHPGRVLILIRRKLHPVTGGAGAPRRLSRSRRRL